MRRIFVVALTKNSREVDDLPAVPAVPAVT